MGKSRADIQKAYRQRLKEKNNEQYLAKERDRRRRNYIPNEQLSTKKRQERNQKNRDYLKQYRRKKKEAAALIHQEPEPNTSGYESTASRGQNRMVVRLNYPNRSNGPRMRISKELDKARKELKQMKERLFKSIYSKV